MDEKQSANPSSKEFYSHPQEDVTPKYIIDREPAGLEVVELSNESGSVQTQPKPWWRRKTVIAVGIIAFLAVLAIGLGVGLAKSKDNGKDTEPASADSTANSTSSADSESSASTVDVADLKYDLDTALTAVFLEESSMLFYQVSTGELMYATREEGAWKKSSNGSYGSLLSVGALAKDKSPLAAVGWNTGSSDEVHLFYVSTDSTLEELVFSDGSWNSGPLSAGNYAAHESTKLAASTFNDLAEIHLLYQRSSGSIEDLMFHIGTDSDKWDTISFDDVTQPKLGTDLALMEFPWPGYPQLRMYAQDNKHQIHQWGYRTDGYCMGISKSVGDEGDKWVECTFSFNGTADGYETPAAVNTSIAAVLRNVSSLPMQIDVYYQRDEDVKPGTFSLVQWQDDGNPWAGPETATPDPPLRKDGNFVGGVEGTENITWIYGSDLGVAEWVWSIDYKDWTVNEVVTVLA